MFKGDLVHCYRVKAQFDKLTMRMFFLDILAY